MTAPLIQTLTVTRGDDYGGTLTFDQAVAGFTEIYFTVRTEWAVAQTDNTDAVYAASIAGGQLLTTGVYTATIDIPNSVTVGWTLESYFYDVQVVTSAGKKYTTQRGRLLMSPDATR